MHCLFDRDSLQSYFVAAGAAASVVDFEIAAIAFVAVAAAGEAVAVVTSIGIAQDSCS